MIDATSMLSGAAAPSCGMLLPLASDAAPAPGPQEAGDASPNPFADLLALANAPLGPGASTTVQAAWAAAAPAFALPEAACRAPEPGAGGAEGAFLPPLPAMDMLELLADVGTRIQARLPDATGEPRPSHGLPALRAIVVQLGRMPAAPAEAACDPANAVTPLSQALPGLAAASEAPLAEPTPDVDDEAPAAEAVLGPLAAPMPEPLLPAALAPLPEPRTRLPLPAAQAPRTPAIVAAGAPASAAPLIALESEGSAPRSPARGEPPAPRRAADRLADAPTPIAAAASAPRVALPIQPPAVELPSVASSAAIEAAAPPLPLAGHPVVEALPRAALPRAEPALPFQAQLSAAIDSPGFGAALGVQISTLVAGDISQARLHLNPAELGPISVHIGLDGQLAQVHLAVEHAATRQALEQALPELVQALREAGFTMTGGGVSQQPREPQPQASPRSPVPAGEAADTALNAPPAALRSRQGLVDVFA